MKHAQYYRNIANGIARINQCIFACKLATVETGTFYSKRFKKNEFKIPESFKFSNKDMERLRNAITKDEPYPEYENIPDMDMRLMKGLKHYVN